jgi:hypothetical protein
MMMIKRIATASVAGAALLGLAATTTPASAAAGRSKAVVYVAKLHPMNTKVTGSETTGTARFTVRGGKLLIDIRVKGAPPNIEHWQHFHGFKNQRAASCPTAAADANHDGIIDLIETEPSSGTTMVPFNANPAVMKIPTNTYPKASADGRYTYKKTVSLKALRAAFAKAFGSRHLDLDHRVVFIHGVPSSTKLPATVASLGPIPAQVTIPIACGKIERAK